MFALGVDKGATMPRPAVFVETSPSDMLGG
jgi:hypothetical protein